VHSSYGCAPAVKILSGDACSTYLKRFYRN
jgi:hypothetical protein